MRKRSIVLFTVSLIAGLLHAPKKKKTPLAEQNNTRYFVGSWQYLDNEQRQHSLVISPSLELIIDQKPIKASIINSSGPSLVYRDALGYQLKLQTNLDGLTSFYDEADNISYPLTHTN